MDAKHSVGIVGATGVVGNLLLGALQERGARGEQLRAFASDRNEGGEVEFADETLEVEKVTGPESFRGLSAVLLATPADVSRRLASAAQAAGAWAVDLSPAFRLDPATPLVHPGVNPEALSKKFQGRVVSCPGATTAALATLGQALLPLHPRKLLVTALISVSNAGTPGIQELEEQTAELLSGEGSEPVRFPHRVAFNVIPQVGDHVASTGEFFEEASWPAELRRLWEGLPEAPVVVGTALQIPTFHGHALSVWVEFEGNTPASAVREALGAHRGIKVLDTPAERIYPMPQLVTGDPALQVGRLRSVSERQVGLFATFDNAGRAAYDAVAVMEALVAGGK